MDIADLKSTMNQFNTIKIYTIFTQQQDTNSIQVPIDYKSGDHKLEHIQEHKTRCKDFMIWMTDAESYRVCSLLTVELC